MDLQSVKQRFGIIGSDAAVNRAVDIAVQVAGTDLSVLVTGESGTGKEFFPQIIHQYSARKHAQYIAVNCGAIPEGTINSELFGHEKGSFTGAVDNRKGYFEVADGGTIFLDELAELPLSTQVRLLRVLESGEFMKVGSSKIIKSDVRIIAATNVNLPNAIQHGRFREDLFYRLNTVPINIPPLRDRKADIYLLFRKFAADFSEKYRMPTITLEPEARALLEEYKWPGNIRQLKNVTEQISIIETERRITGAMLALYLPLQSSSLPILYQSDQNQIDPQSEKFLYKILFDMRNDVNELKRWMLSVRNENGLDTGESEYIAHFKDAKPIAAINIEEETNPNAQHALSVQASLQEQEVDTIKRILKLSNYNRKEAAKALGISVRTLYRKIKENDIVEED